MLDVLSRALDALPALLEDPEEWHTMDIDYHPPRVERVFREFSRDVRLMLHRIEPCAKEAALFHPHPWPSAMKVLTGTYWMRVGSAPGVRPPAHVLEMQVTATPETDFRYAMTNPDGWHAVVPVDGPVYSVMVVGPTWDRPIPRVTKDKCLFLDPLPRDRKATLLDEFYELTAPLARRMSLDSVG